MPSTPSHPRLITVSLHRLSSCSISLSHLPIPPQSTHSLPLCSSQLLSLLNATSHSLCILPLVLPVHLPSYSPADRNALASLTERLDQLGFNTLAHFTTGHTFCLFSPLATDRLPDFLRSSDLLLPGGHIADLPVSPTTTALATPITPTLLGGLDDPGEPCPCCRRLDCGCPDNCSNCAQSRTPVRCSNCNRWAYSSPCEKCLPDRH